MPTCKDCLHLGVCEKYKRTDHLEELKDGCIFFKDRSKFIELPCKLGDKVFYFDTAGTIYKQTIFQFIYGGTGLKLDSDVMFDSKLIGNEFFLSYEEAEQALKEQSDD